PAGLKMRCPKCAHSFLVLLPGTAAPAAPPATASPGPPSPAALPVAVPAGGAGRGGPAPGPGGMRSPSVTGASALGTALPAGPSVARGGGNKTIVGIAPP